MNMRIGVLVVLFGACGHGSSPPEGGVPCQIDDDCGGQYCSAGACTARPHWKAPTMFGACTVSNTTITVRSDNLESIRTCGGLLSTTSGRLTNLEPADDPELSSDGLELLFARDGAMLRSRRATIDEAFASANEATELRVANAALFGPTLSADGLVVVFRTTPFDSLAHAFQAERATTTEPFGPPHDLAALSRAFELETVDQFGPATSALSPDARLLLIPDRKGENFLIFTRDDPADDFAETGSVTELAGVESPYFAPFIARNGELYFTSQKVEMQVIFHAERE